MDILFVLLSIILITTLIVVHECGHFLAARYFGFQTPAFGIGLPFGPTINLFKKWGTQFKFHWFLIGGYVSIPELGDETDPQVLKEMKLEKPLQHFPVWQRAIVASAGIVFNILFAFIICIVMSGTIGLPDVVANNQVSGFVADNPTAKNAGLKEGDIIVGINTYKVNNGNELKELVQTYKNTEIKVTVNRPIEAEEKLGEVTDNSPQSKIDERQSYETLDFTMQNKGTIGVMLGYKQEYKKVGSNPLVWIWESFLFTSQALVAMTVSVVMLLFAFITKIFSFVIPQVAEPAAPLDQVKGIVGIVQFISQDIQKNWLMALQVMVLLNLNLAVINLLPIPALDGGHLMFMAYESIAGKKPSEKIQQTAIQAGFIFLLGIIAITTFNDIKNWIFG